MNKIIASVVIGLSLLSASPALASTIIITNTNVGVIHSTVTATASTGGNTVGAGGTKVTGNATASIFVVTRCSGICNITVSTSTVIRR